MKAESAVILLYCNMFTHAISYKLAPKPRQDARRTYIEYNFCVTLSVFL